jgi:tellurium resistance protein TerD
MSKAISLEKNQKVNLTKASDFLQKVKVRMSWVTPKNVFPKYDLDISAFLLGSDGKLLSDEGFVYFNQDATPDRSVWKTEDEQDSGSEELYIDLTKLSPAVSEISLVSTIHKAETRKQSFDKVTNAKLEIFDQSDILIANFDLDTLAPGSWAIQIGSFYQTEEGFTFQGIGTGFQLELGAFFEGYK